MKLRTNVTLLAVFVLALVLVWAVASMAAAKDPGEAHAKPHKHAHHHKGHKHKAPKPPKSFYGIVPQDQITGSDFRKMHQNGVATLRTGLYWQQVQPTGPTDWDFSRFDKFVEQGAENGITILPFLYGAPDWVAKGLDGDDCGDCRYYAPTSGAALSAWQDFASHAVARYGPKGDFWHENPDVPKTPIHNWQIWNEQNSKTFYKPKPDVTPYSKLLSHAADGIRSEDPKAQIVLGGMFGLPGKSSKAIAAATFVHNLLKKKGAKQDFDGVALHPYSKGLNFVKKQAVVMRDELRKSHDPDAGLWITETGAASGGNPSGLNLGSKKAQAQRVTDTYKLFTAHRKDWNVKLVAWFSWQDSDASDAICYFCAKTGLLDEKGKAKPALTAYKRAAK